MNSPSTPLRPSGRCKVRPVSKRCRRCGEVKALEQFPIARGNRDGRRTECKRCMRAYTAARYRATRTTVPDPSPARTLRTVLSEFRQDGLSFEVAWPAAVDRALSVAGDPTWAGAFRWSMPAWEHAYKRRPPTRGERLRVAPDDLTPAA
jgi:hypothetical protein